MNDLFARYAMDHQVVLEVPDDVYQPLLRQAEESGRSLEDLVSEFLALVARANKPTSPLRKWAGVLASGVTDAGLNHDEYLGQAVAEKLRDKPE